MLKITIPFKIKNVFEGFAESDGLLRLEDERIFLEFQTKDSVVGIIKSELKTVEASVGDIEEIDIKKSVFGNTLTIRFSNMSVTSDIPKQQSGEVKVSIDKKHMETALEFVSSVKLEVADYKMREAEA